MLEEVVSNLFILMLWFSEPWSARAVFVFVFVFTLFSFLKSQRTLSLQGKVNGWLTTGMSQGLKGRQITEEGARGWGNGRNTIRCLSEGALISVTKSSVFDLVTVKSSFGNRLYFFSPSHFSGFPLIRAKLKEFICSLGFSTDFHFPYSTVKLLDVSITGHLYFYKPSRQEERIFLPWGSGFLSLTYRAVVGSWGGVL